MPRNRRRHPLPHLLAEQSADDDHNKREQEHKYGKPVDKVHFRQPVALRGARFFFLQVQVFGNLFQNAHKKYFLGTQN